MSALADGPLPPRMHCCERTVAGVGVLVCGTGYTGEDGVELLHRPGRRARPSGTRCWPAALCRSASAPATRCDSKPASTSMATISVRTAIRSAPASAGRAQSRPGSSAPTRWQRSGAAGPRAEARPVRDRRAGNRPAGKPPRGGGEVTSGTFSPCLQRGIGMAYIPAERAAPGTRFEIDVRGTIRPALVEQKPLYRKDA